MYIRYSFLWYKWNRPDMERPFKIPGGFFGGLCVVLPCLALTFATFYFAVIDKKPVFGIPYGKACGLGAVTAVGLIVHFISYLWRCCFGTCCGMGGEEEDEKEDEGDDEKLPLMDVKKSYGVQNDGGQDSGNHGYTVVKRGYVGSDPVYM